MSCSFCAEPRPRQKFCPVCSAKNESFDPTYNSTEWARDFDEECKSGHVLTITVSAPLMRPIQQYCCWCGKNVFGAIRNEMLFRMIFSVGDEYWEYITDYGKPCQIGGPYKIVEINGNDILVEFNHEHDFVLQKIERLNFLTSKYSGVFSRKEDADAFLAEEIERFNNDPEWRDRYERNVAEIENSDRADEQYNARTDDHNDHLRNCRERRQKSFRFENLP